jgi:putative tryptophan/tyrosine transport system substrate-binding protein
MRGIVVPQGSRAAHRALRDLGYVEGHNLAVEYRYAEGRPERLPDLAADLARSKPDVLFALGGDVFGFSSTHHATS